MSTYLEINAPAPDGAEGSMLSRAIKSVVSQSYWNWELWVVSDHPPERDRKAIEKLIASIGDPRIHYEDLAARAGVRTLGVEPKRRGVGRSRGELLAFLDADNAFERDHLYRAVQTFNESGEALDLVYCDTRVICGENFETEDLDQGSVTFLHHLLGTLHGDSQKKQSSPEGPLDGGPFTWEKPFWNPAAAEKMTNYTFIDMSDAVMTRSAYNAAGGLQDSICADWQLWHDMIRTGHDRFRHIPFVGVHYTTQDLARHRQHYALTLVEKLNLPFNLVNAQKNIEEALIDQYEEKHGGAQRRSTRDERPRILFMAEAAALSHVVRPAMLAAHLHRQDYNVCLASDRRYDTLISDNGFKRVDLYSLPSSVILDRISRYEPIWDVETLDRYAQQDLKILDEFKPDVVVGDQRHSLATSSRLAGVPYVNIVDGHWCPAAELEIELVASALSPRINGIPILNLFFQLIRPLALGYQTMPINIIRMKYGLPAMGPDFKTVISDGDYVVYPNDPAFFPLKESLAPTHQFIGPLVWSPKVEKPAWWYNLPEARPIVYVSLGSTGQPDLLESVFKVLGELTVTVIAATAGRKQMQNVPNNIFVADFLPGTEAAQRSRLVICNGGTMSGQQALSVGVPYLGLVSNVDQLLFAKAVSQSGACEFIREGEVNENTLRHFIRMMLAQESYRSAARMIATRSVNRDSCLKFEKLIGSIVEERGRRKFHTHSMA